MGQRDRGQIGTKEEEDDQERGWVGERSFNHRAAAAEPVKEGGRSEWLVGSFCLGRVFMALFAMGDVDVDVTVAHALRSVMQARRARLKQEQSRASRKTVVSVTIAAVWS